MGSGTATGSAARLHPDFQRFVDDIAAAEAAGQRQWHELTIPELRIASREARGKAALVTGIRRRELQVVGATGPLGARLYEPEDSANAGPGLVYFHGGGFAIGSIDTHDRVVAKLCQLSQVRILSVEYRLAPEHRFPAAHEDALASTRWAFDHADEIGFVPELIGVGGDSAGSNLAASAALRLKDDPSRQLQFLMLLYPNTRIAGEAGSRAIYSRGYYLTLAAASYLFRAYVSEKDEQDPRIDLLRHPDLSNLPPTYLTVGECDILFDECLLFYDRLLAANVRTNLRIENGYIHGFFGYENRAPGVHDAFVNAAAEMQAALRQSAPTNDLTSSLQV